MPSTHHSAMALTSTPSTTILVALVLVSLFYVRGWRCMRRAPAGAIPGWRLGSFLFGMLRKMVRLPGLMGDRRVEGVVSHPGDRNKDVARMGHPIMVGGKGKRELGI